MGEHFAQAFRLEASSIPAFRILARELSEHRAPGHLVRAAHRAEADEVRHVRATAALARRYGATPVRPRYGTQHKNRSLETIASENAVEGCVRETYGALVALWQARYAADPVVAAAMAPIADDETRHAELAWEVAAWAETKLSRAARVRVADARVRALSDLRAEAYSPNAASLVREAGVPPPATAAHLLRSLAEVLDV
jgi:hypothetical protein